ncbi:MAG: YchJ family metal-binding protein [Pontiella sp.]
MKFDKCPCGSGAQFTECCGGIIAGERKAQTAEQLMRSRYTAYMLKKTDYLLETTHPDFRPPDLAKSIRKWMKQVEWLKLHIVATEGGSEMDSFGHVEFIAEFISNTGPGRHHECSVFEKVDESWYYVGEETEAG